MDATILILRNYKHECKYKYYFICFLVDQLLKCRLLIKELKNICANVIIV